MLQLPFVHRKIDSPRAPLAARRAQRVPTQRLPSRRAGFEELEIDWGPASPFGPDDDPGTPMTHQDSSESDELRPDLFEEKYGAAPLPAPEPVVTPAANAQPERPVAPFVRTLYALLEGPYDETLCEWSENGRRIVFPDPTLFAETCVEIKLQAPHAIESSTRCCLRT